MAADDPVKFVAIVSPVREVSLLGTADLAFWADQLTANRLIQMALEGEARVMISASDAKYMGIRFCELSISIFCQRQYGDQQEAVFLAQAFNTVRWFAWVERSMFSTRYKNTSNTSRLGDSECSRRLHHRTFPVRSRPPARTENQNCGVSC
jgi:hypothetical protein